MFWMFRLPFTILAVLWHGLELLVHVGGLMVGAHNNPFPDE